MPTAQQRVFAMPIDCRCPCSDIAGVGESHNVNAERILTDFATYDAGDDKMTSSLHEMAVQRAPMTDCQRTDLQAVGSYAGSVFM